MKIIISGGGTGGHLFPALALADALSKEYSGCEIIFVGAKNKMEMEIVPNRGYKIKGLYISGFHRGEIIRNLFFLFKLFISLINSFFIIIKNKPDLVIGTGGFASGPILFCATIFNIPTLIQEQNSFPGITNRILGKFVNKVCVSYDNMNRYFKSSKLSVTGNPIRESILCFNKKQSKSHSFFGLSNKKTVLILGGSLGAHSINKAVYNLIKNNEFDFNILWQTGKLYYDKIQSDLILRKENIKIVPFISEMDLAFSVADVIVSRAGAITISELMFVGKPVILVPSPNVAENHQYKNAKVLKDQNAALLIQDKQVVEDLPKILFSVIENKQEIKSLGKNIKAMYNNNAVDKILIEIKKILK
ncbi:MAG: undecaprenyldiphospho-muramoylpentapeptide beta-N-acetylglucosaminyltransferase [Flavobacteriales bacterium]|nr:undecaprenyldiphospho-muramoylpentapeptide beta-N-acetylglucosaminyltransferase [Flavobacteriales bacterium]|tara:strand:+ start:211 stop:1293 length:1083 start_codon:yes stop_codon:yes gene_type:complete